MVLLLNDCEKGAGVDLAKKYNVRVYPTFAMVDDAGEVTARWAGYEGVARFIAQVDAARADMSTIAAKKQRFADEPTLPLALALAQHAEAVFAAGEAVEYYRHALTLEPSLAGELRVKIFMAMYYGLGAEEFTVAQLLAEGDAILADPETSVELVLQVASAVKRAAPPAQYVPYLERALAVTAEVPADPELAADYERYRRQLAVDEALLIRRDRTLALRLRRENLSPDWMQDTSEVHRFAWWCYENDLNLAEAYRLTVAAAAAVAGDADRASILNTGAALAFKLGDLQQAVAHQQEVVALSPARERYQTALRKYEAAHATAAGEFVEPRSQTAFPDRITIANGAGTATLVATGAGLRQRTIMKIDAYAIVSYVSAGLDLAAAADAGVDPGAAIRVVDAPKRIQLDLKRNAPRDRLIGSLAKAIAANYPDMSAFSDDLAAFRACFDRDGREGDRIVFDYLPDAGLVITLNGEFKGAIAGPAFMEALWSVWFGARPVDERLKQDLTARV